MAVPQRSGAIGPSALRTSVRFAAREDRGNRRPRRADERAQALGHGYAEAREPVAVERRKLCAEIADKKGRNRF